MKALLRADAAEIAAGGGGLLDRAFIAEHIDRLRQPGGGSGSGDLGRDRARLGTSSPRPRSSRRDLQIGQECHHLLWHGNYPAPPRHVQRSADRQPGLACEATSAGRAPGSMPLRGHSNVQGDRTVGIHRNTLRRISDSRWRMCSVSSRRAQGTQRGGGGEAHLRGQIERRICLGGNLAVAMSDPDTVFPGDEETGAWRSYRDQAQSFASSDRPESILLPCLGRTELDMQAGGRQAVTVEDLDVDGSCLEGGLKPASRTSALGAYDYRGAGKATLPNTKVDWDSMVADYSLIRDKIERFFPTLPTLTIVSPSPADSA